MARQRRDNAPMDYEHTQRGYTGILTTALMIGVGWVSLPETFAESLWIGVLVSAFMVGIIGLTFWFSRLVVVVAGGEVTASFGLGKPHRVVRLSDVVGTTQVRNSWIQGWGVRKVTRGWMYNVWGLDAVEIELNSDEVFRIGTDDADALQAAISLSTPA